MDPVPFDRTFDPQALLAHAGWIRRLAHELVPADAHLADDLAQETWRVALEHAPSTERSLGAWLATVLRNLVRQEHRGSGRRKDRERVVARPEAQPAPADHDATLAVHHDLVRAVMSLDEPYRETIVLRFFEEFGPSAIARRQQIPVATVKTRLSRALEQLRRKLDGAHGGDGRTWIAALVPHCKLGAGVGTVTMGALIMGTKLKIAAAVVVVLALVAVWSLRVSSIERADARIADDPHAAALAASSSTRPLARTGGGSERMSAIADSTIVPTTDLDVLVVDESGSPIADTPVMLLDAKGSSQSARTDAAGHAGFQSRPGRGALFLHRPDDAPRRVELETSTGARRVQLPQMAEVSGLLRENGRPLAAPILLVMLSHERLFPGIDLPQEVSAFLGLEDDGNYRFDRLTGSDSSFRYAGLPDSWSGRLVLPNTWAVADSQRTSDNEHVMVVGAPVKNLVIEVDHLPHLSGRVLDAEHRPAVRARVDVAIRWSDDSGWCAGTFSRKDGRFEITTGVRTDLKDLVLDAHGDDGHGSAVLVRRSGDLDSTRDLGDVVLARGAALQLHVTDEAGQPIAGAVAFVDRSKPATKTDKQGDCVITDIPVGSKEVHVAAAHFFGTSVPLPLSGTDPHSIVLAPCNRLTVQVRGPGDQPPGPLVVRISAGEEALIPEWGFGEIDTHLPERIVGKTIGVMSNSENKDELGFAPDTAGILSIEAVVTNTPLRIRIADRLGHVAREMKLAALGEREDRHVDVMLDRSTRAIRGRVLDETGAPVPGANVDVGAGRGFSLPTRTDGDGRFEFDPTFADAIDLGVRKDGFALVRKLGVRLQDPPVDIAITLEHGRRVKVSVVDTSARAVDTGNLSVFDPQSNSGWPSRPLGPGLFEIADLPAHEIELRLYLSGKQYAQIHDPHVPEARIEVPVHGRVVVTWSTDMQDRHVVTLVPEDTTLGELISFASEKSSGESVLESVLPGQWHVSFVTTGQAKPGDKVPQATVTVQPDATVRVNLSQ